MRLFRGLWGVAIGVAVLVVASALAMMAGASAAPHAETKTIGPLYNLTFQESGLPAGTNWSVHVGYVGCGCDGVHKTVTSSNPTIVIGVTNGTYNYQIEKVAGFYVNGTAHGQLNLTPPTFPTISVQFLPIVPFTAEFVETGLPNGTLWTVSVTGNGHGQEKAAEDQTASSYTTTLNFSLPNGTYHYSVAKVSGSFFVNHTNTGKFVIAGASPAPVDVTFTTPPLYALTFTETGLPNGTNWSVRVAGFGGVHISETLASSTDNVTFELPNGSYHYVVAEVLGFGLSTPTVGPVALTNQSVQENVTFYALAEGAFYPVAFEENGLANGTHWAVTVTATHTFGHSKSETQSSTGTTIFFLLQNGTYKFTVHNVRTYTIATGGSGGFSVLGAAPGVQVVNYTATPTYTVTITESGLANGTAWAALVRSTNAKSTPWLIHMVHASNNTTMTFVVPNGSYCYKVYNVAGYKITTGPAAGSFSVSGASPATISIVFTAKG